MSRASFYDILAPVYGRLVSNRVERTLFRAVQRVGAGSPVSLLELAVGPGATVPLLKRRVPGARTVALDISRRMLRLTRKEASKAQLDVRLVQGDALVLPFADGSFDAVLCAFLLDLVRTDELERSFAELVRVTAPGGRIVLAQLNVNSPLLRSVWKTAYSLLPKATGFPRPIDVSGSYATSGLRILQDEEIEESVGTRVTTLVKVRA